MPAARQRWRMGGYRICGVSNTWRSAMEVWNQFETVWQTCVKYKVTNTAVPHSTLESYRSHDDRFSTFRSNQNVCSTMTLDMLSLQCSIQDALDDVCSQYLATSFSILTTRHPARIDTFLHGTKNQGLSSTRAFTGSCMCTKIPREWFGWISPVARFFRM